MYVSEIEIREVDAEKAKEDYGDDIFEESVVKFVEERYDDFKKLYREAYENKNLEDLKAHIHKFKTNARITGCEEIGKKCEEIEVFLNDRKDPEKFEMIWKGIDSLWEYFLIDYDKYHLEAVKLYMKIFPDKIPCESFVLAKKKLEEIDKNKFTIKKQIDNIIINSKDASEQFGETLFRENVESFIDNYEEIKKSLIDAFNNKNISDLKNITGKLKTTVKYFYSNI